MSRQLDLEAMLSDLAALVNIESPSRDLAALDTSAAVLSDIIEKRLGSAPSIHRSEAGPHVHWSGGGDPSVLLVGHHDTVFPLGTLEKRPFRIDAGRVYGPGVFDMKAGIVQAIHGVASLEDSSQVEIFLSADEEVGSGTSKNLIIERARASGSALVLEPSADGGALKSARKGTGTYELIVHGRASHAGLEPEKGVNALVEAATQVLRIATFGDPSKGTTVTPTVADVGTADNVVPARARILIDVRADDPNESARVQQAMNGLQPQLPGASLELLGGFNRPPMPASASTRLLNIAENVARDLGLGEISAVAVGGGSDGNFTAAAGVPTLDGLGAVGGGAHADHEWVDSTAMVDRSRLLAGLIERI
ncbi:MAG: M20 family metallopeptidase, partial [Actinomycetota bacterium]